MTPAFPARLHLRDKILIALGVIVVIALCILISPPKTLEKNYHWIRSESQTSAGSGPLSASLSSQESIIAALREVKDPEIGVNIIDLGLIYSSSIGAGKVNMVMTLTTPTCPYGSKLIEEVKKTLFSDPSVRELELKVTFDPPWNVNMIAPEVREKFFHEKSASKKG